MQQVKNIKELETVKNKNEEIVISNNKDKIIVMDMEKYKKKLLNKDIQKHLLKAEDDIKNGRVREAREVFGECKEKYGI